jgi:RecA-family ATPase
LRELQFKKVQYGPQNESIILRYQEGVFVPVRGASSLEKAAHEMQAEQMFIELLRRFEKDGRNVCHSKKANNYAPTMFAEDPEAKKAQLGRKDFEAAMVRLFGKDKGKLVVESYGPPSKRWSRLVERGGQ